MQRFFRSVATITFVSILACVPTFLSSQSASAEQRMKGSYVGAGVSVDSGGASPTVNGRFDLDSFSIRATVTGACESGVCATLFIPTVTYDFGLSEKANIYAGIGGSVFTLSDSSFSVSLGTGAVLQAGAEGAITKDIVIYGDGTYFTNGGGTLLKVGVGYKW
ncbi:hypothetical protein DSM106972_072360 [Dulcicalothrix desertica PCC 7102]|uniref:Outer membrane protein beta-barrel domain-containing protein n=1 Tax=Dulcicalothrix desertica PCC 7102 TaxID=232991 RepID=A0A3S1CCL1_9CYAN|nr:hypothetical protein [Dulcicalothrix desertica]RUT00827.1 hypothetical protein DSM106972_072360 [Dulcicalothrix desertica PCC 7102]TWH42333.1 hypothetical protein CAL7102_05978 [Dulcicalothrix desertica PCC 7102]